MGLGATIPKDGRANVGNPPTLAPS